MLYSFVNRFSLWSMKNLSQASIIFIIKRNAKVTKQSKKLFLQMLNSQHNAFDMIKSYQVL